MSNINKFDFLRKNIDCIKIIFKDGTSLDIDLDNFGKLLEIKKGRGKK